MLFVTGVTLYDQIDLMTLFPLLVPIETMTRALIIGMAVFCAERPVSNFTAEPSLVYGPLT